MLLLLPTCNYCTQWEAKTVTSCCASLCLTSHPGPVTSMRDGECVCCPEELRHQPLTFPGMLLLFRGAGPEVCSGEQHRGASAPPNLSAPLIH